jgi:Putative MetA-pathway of phenol degradation
MRTAKNGLRTARLSFAMIMAFAALRADVPAAAQSPPAAASGAHATSGDEQLNPDRPGIADGSAVVGAGRWQVETGFQAELRRLGGSTEHTYLVPTLLRVGLNDRWEARVESNTLTRTATADPGGATQESTGVSPVSAGVKFQIQDADGPHRPSLGMILRVFPPSGTNLLKTTRATGDLRLAGDWDLTPGLSLNPNIGIALYNDDGGKAFTAELLALTLNVTNRAKTINPFVDAGFQTPEGSAEGSSLIVDGGIAYLPGRNVQIDVSGGAGVHGSTAPHRFFSVGISLRSR